MGPEWRPWSLVTRLGLTVVLTLLITLFAGIWLDRVFGSRPLMTLVMALIGMVAATVNCYRMVVSALGDIPAPRRGDGTTRDATARRNGEGEEDESDTAEDEKGDD